MRKLNLLTLLIFFALFLTACAASTAQSITPTNEPVADVEEVADVSDGETLSANVADGFELYSTVGCAGCHGAEGEGNVGPALAGHTRDQVFRQVRTPKGDIMPAFLEDRLSDADIENIVVWIDSLGSEMLMEHAEEAEINGASPELSMTEADHLRLVLDSLAAENETDAMHHAQHLVEDASPEVLPLAEKVLSDLQVGNLHEVETETGVVLGSLADSDFDTVSAHLGMALSASQRDDATDVEHHLGSAAQAAANHDHQTEMEQMLADWHQGDKQHNVVNRMYEMLGLDHSD